VDPYALGKFLSVEKIAAFPVREPSGVFRESEYEAGDLRQRAFLKTLEILSESSKMKSAPLPPFPIPLPPGVQHVWNTTVAEAREKEVENNLGQIKAGLSVPDEIIRQKVRDELKNLFATSKRRRNLSRATAGFREKGLNLEPWRADWGHTTGVVPEPEEYLGEQDSFQEIVARDRRAYEKAVKRSGEPGRVFLDGLKAGLSVKDAALAADISTRTGNRIIEAIKQNPSEKTSTKQGVRT
jgi:hypothetical protein